MTISVGWTTDQVISIAKTDMVQVQTTPVEVYELNANTLFTTLKDLEATEEGIPWPDTQSNNSPVTLGGLTFARVLEILDPYTITFEDGQYVVDVTGANTNILDRTNPNQVSVRTNNSAGLVGTRQIENQSYTDARVWVDTVNGQAGTTYPLGTPATPSSNFPEAIAIQQQRNLPPRFRGVGNAIVTTGAVIDNFDLLGASPELSTFVIQSGVSTENLVVSKVSLTAVFDGDVDLTLCFLGVISGFSGVMYSCSLLDDITIDNVRTSPILIRDCNSFVAGVNRPTLDVNGASADILLDRFTGGIEIRNMTAGNSMTINANGCSVRIHPSCTSGVIKVRGDFALENNASANPGLTVLTYENNEDSKWEQVQKIYKRLGLKRGIPMTDTPSGISTSDGDIVITRTGDGETSSTLERQ